MSDVWIAPDAETTLRRVPDAAHLDAAARALDARLAPVIDRICARLGLDYADLAAELPPLPQSPTSPVPTSSGRGTSPAPLAASRVSARGVPQQPGLSGGLDTVGDGQALSGTGKGASAPPPSTPATSRQSVERLAY